MIGLTLECRSVEHTGISCWRWAHPAEGEEARDDAHERTSVVFSHAKQAYPHDGLDSARQHPRSGSGETCNHEQPRRHPQAIHVPSCLIVVRISGWWVSSPFLVPETLRRLLCLVVMVRCSVRFLLSLIGSRRGSRLLVGDGGWSYRRAAQRLADEGIVELKVRQLFGKRRLVASNG